ncbi:MAG: PKD domain-containing protein [Thermoplasmata archaeon]|nr:MAG: PKD domain-containing protein [Thermoplasmata archaeon]
MKRTITNPILCLLLISALFAGIVNIPSPSEAETNEPWDGGTGMDPIAGDNIWNTNGSWDIVDGDTIVHQDKTIIVNGDLTVDGTGSLTLINVTLKINVSSDGEFAIVVQNGGTFIIRDTDLDPLTKDDASNITSWDPNLRYSFGVYGASSTFEMRNSELHYCGYSAGTYWRDLGLMIASEYSLIEGNHIADCYRGIIVRDTNNVTVQNNVIEKIDNIGVYTNNVTYCYFMDNTVSNIQNFSMYFYASTYLNISYNDVIDSPNAYGITLDGGIMHDVFNNTIDNHNLGVFINGDISDVNVLLCDIHENEILNNENGIWLQGRNGPSAVRYIFIYDNEIYSNNVDGIRLFGVDTIFGATAVHNIYVYDNVVYDNGGGSSDGHGIHFAVGSWWALGLIYCYDNEVRDNHNSANTGSGYYLEVVSQILIDGGLIARNDRNIWVEATDNVYITNCTLEKSSNPGDVDVRVEDNYGNPPSVFFLNTTFDNSTTSAVVEDADSFLDVKNYLHVRIMQMGGGVDNADVWIDDWYGNPDPPVPQPLSTGVGNNGWIRWLEVKEFNRTAGGTTYYTPHHIDAENGTAFGSGDATMNMSREVIIYLSGPPTADEIDSTALDIYRGQVVNITANGSDPEDSEEDLIPYFQYKEPGTSVWNTTYLGTQTYIGTAPSGFWQVNFTPDASAPEGPYEFRVRFEDTNGGFSNWLSAVLVSVQNNLPIADAGPDDTASAGTPYNFNGSGSWDFEGITIYEWDIDDSDGVNFSPPDLTGISPSYTYTIPGVYNVTLRITDTDTITDTDVVQITVKDNEPPHVDAGLDGSIMKNTLYMFDGSGSWDNVGIVWYNWSFGDGFYDNGTNITPTHIYTFSGLYTATLKCTDANGNWATDIVNITVTDSLPPIANAGLDDSTDEDLPIVFNGSLSWDDFGITDYLWDIDDSDGLDWGSPDKMGMEVNWTYDTPGDYVVTLRVIDADGGWGMDILNVTVFDVTSPMADAGPNDSVDEDTSYTFDGTLSYDNSGSIAFYNWDFGDGNYSNGTDPSPSHEYAQPDVYIVTLNVTDLSGNSGIDTVWITVIDITFPSADAGPDNVTDEGSPVVFDGSASSDNVGIFNYAWDMNASDGLDWATPDRTGPNPIYTYMTPNTYIVTLNVTDAEGNSDTDTLSITVLDVTPPTAHAGDDATVDEDTSHTFDGSGSDDNVGIATYAWDIDASDGVDWVTPDYLGVSPSHVYSEPGVYIATLKVTDVSDYWTTDTVTIRVLDVTDPLANAGPDDSVNNDTAYLFDGSLSSDNSGVIEFYNWTFGDGNFAYDAGPNPSHTYTTPSVYIVVLTVTDEAGNSGTDSLTITVIDARNPFADAGDDVTIDEDLPHQFDASKSSDDVGIVNYAWDIDKNDGVDWVSPDYSGPSLWNPMHTYNEPGIYVITLNVTDEEGNWNTDTVQITVLDVTSPTADAGSDDTVDEDTPYIFDGLSSFDNVDVVEYKWDINASDGLDWVTPDYTGSNPSHEYSEPGTYTVTLNVTDEQGNWNTAEIHITVLDVTEPTADAGSDTTIDEESPYTFDASGSSDNVDIASYAWDFDESDGIDWSNPDESGPSKWDPDHIYTEPGTYSVTLNVTDTSGNWNLDTVTITVLDITLPNADAGPDGIVNEESPYTFDASASSDNVDIFSYAWDMDINDGLNWDDPDHSGSSPLHTYSEPGVYLVTLNVTDTSGNWNHNTLTIEVLDITPPFADAGEDDTIDEDTPYTFDASASYDNVGIVTYLWDIDNSDGIDWNNPDYTGISPTHVFTEPGNYIVTLIVYDAQGNSNIDPVAIEVKLVDEERPALNVEFEDTMHEEVEYEFNASKSDDNVGIVSYHFTFGDGNQLFGSDDVVTHTYDDPGVYTMTVNITDSAGNWNTSSWFVTVLDTTPPLPTSGLTYTKIQTGGALNITWNPNIEEDFSHYELYFSDDGQVYDKIETFSHDVTYYYHSGLINGQNYSYFIVAVDDAGLSSSVSNIISAKPEIDSDGDGLFDSEDPDDDQDNVPDDIDEFPNNPTEWVDTDSDGLGDNIDDDDDDDGVIDSEDDFPYDPEETLDTDGDGIGDKTDEDDDNDGKSDANDDYPLDSSKWKETSDESYVLWLFLALIGIIVAVILGALFAKERSRNQKLLTRINDLDQARGQLQLALEAQSAMQATVPQEEPQVIAKEEAPPAAAKPVQPRAKPPKKKKAPAKKAPSKPPSPPPLQEAEPEAPSETFEIIEDETPPPAPPPIPPEELPPPEPKKEVKKRAPPPPPDEA